MTVLGWIQLPLCRFAAKVMKRRVAVAMSEIGLGPSIFTAVFLVCMREVSGTKCFSRASAVLCGEVWRRAVSHEPLAFPACSVTALGKDCRFLLP